MKITKEMEQKIFHLISVLLSDVNNVDFDKCHLTYKREPIFYFKNARLFIPDKWSFCDINLPIYICREIDNLYNLIMLNRKVKESNEKYNELIEKVNSVIPEDKRGGLSIIDE
jgi:hypothetical protein